MSPKKTDSQQDLAEALLDFESIVAELNYRQAQNSLRSLIGNLDLTAEEQQGLELDIDRLSGMLDKLEQSIVQIAAFGLVGRGKSSLLNALVGQNIFPTGALHGVTQTVNSANWKLTPEQIPNTSANYQRLAIASQGGEIQLIDTPGIDEVNGEAREALACNLARRVDLILFIVSGDITQVEYSALAKLREAGKPMLLVFNKIDRYPEADRLAIYHKIKEDRVRDLISPDEIIMVAASPIEVRGVKDKTGKLKVERIPGQAQIAPLKLKILELLEREGKSLVALNSMLFADEVNQQLLQRKLAIRDIAQPII